LRAFVFNTLSLRFGEIIPFNLTSRKALDDSFYKLKKLSQSRTGMKDDLDLLT